MMRNRVLHWAIRDVWLCDDGWEVAKDGSILILRLTRRQGGANRRIVGSNTLDTELSKSIAKLVVLDVH
jgi:hypothetical protein